MLVATGRVALALALVGAAIGRGNVSWQALVKQLELGASTLPYISDHLVYHLRGAGDGPGVIRPSRTACDKRVIGVVAGAGGYRPAIVLDQQAGATSRRPIALLGKVYCKVSADNAPVGVGDLLTASDVPGHAMRATHADRTFGAVIGKALRPLASGRGLIPILVALQ